MKGLQSFKFTLQSFINPDDRSWCYTIPNLPRAVLANEAGLIKTVSVVSSSDKQYIELRLETAPSNRITRTESLDGLLLVSFANFRLQIQSTEPGQSHRPAPARESGEYITRFLKTGIVLNDVSYNFFGHSNSQLKSRSCYMYAGTKDEISSKIEYMGDFSKLKTVGKKAKRIGLLFSSADLAMSLDPGRCEDIPDVERDDYTFTDGCGLISPTLVRQLVQRRNIRYRNKRYSPAVFQIRYRGYKGVLTLDPSMGNNTLVRFRNSMRKFKDAKDHSFSVVDYSKPYSFGYLNDEIVLLIHSLGVSAEILLRKQASYLDFLRDAAGGDPRLAFQYLTYCNRLDLAERVLIEGVESVAETIRSLTRQEHARMRNKRDEWRCKILIPQSRLLFGVCDPSVQPDSDAKLKSGQCFVRITNEVDGVARTITDTQVLVTRNPCLHPGDIQKFWAVEVPEYSHLVDCIVFPIRGKRPSADLMSGGDLDGDKFFVTWDADIIPSVVSEPAKYPAVKEREAFSSLSGDDRAEYFARYANVSLGRAANLHLKWARLKGPLSAECQELNRLYSQSVDGNRIEIPKRLEDPPQSSSSNNPFILDVLHQACERRLEPMKGGDLFEANSPIDVINTVLSQDSLPLSEFELIQLTLRWCRSNQEDFTQFVDFFHFSSLTDHQQAFLVDQFPPSRSLPSLIRNGLMQSNIVGVSELCRFGLEHPHLHWRRIFDSASDRMGRFLDTMSRAMALFHKKLIIFRPDERLTLAMYVPRQISKASEVQVDTSVRVFAFPQSQGSTSSTYRVMPTKVNYQLYCDESNFQLYEKKRGNTWIFITRGPSDESSYRNIPGRGDKRREKQRTIEDGVNFDCRTSVALDKISKAVKNHVGRVNRAGIQAAEIYTISNRDVQSMRILDQWLRLVDTDEVIPLFERKVVEYDAPSAKDISWNEYTAEVVEVVRDKNMSRLEDISSVDDILVILSLLSEHGEKRFLNEVYKRLLGLVENNSATVDKADLMQNLLTFLPGAIQLSMVFFSSAAWETVKNTLSSVLTSTTPSLLKEVILSANEMHGIVKDLFQVCLDSVTLVSTQQFTELVELVSLTVRVPEVALDLLLECLEPSASRVLVGRPAAISQYVKSVMGVALDHIEEAKSSSKRIEGTLVLSRSGSSDGFAVLNGDIRIDSPLNGLLRQGDHVRLTASNPPLNRPLEGSYSMDAIVQSVEGGSVSFRCLHRPPSYVEQCTWEVTHCGSFVTCKTTFDAVSKFYTEMEACCFLFTSLVSSTGKAPPPVLDGSIRATTAQTLNESQSEAVEASLKHSLTLIWGPPGTGKTHTITEILRRLLLATPQLRILVTAPTHNAVDNILSKYIKGLDQSKNNTIPLRVSTSLSKVDPSLKQYTCDAMVGKELSTNPSARRKAEKQIKESRLIFTTCVGAGLGLLRNESFPVVLIDEASQQTEPATLIPLVKGCRHAILVGDHVQLRATVQSHAVMTNLDISLFERHYNMPVRNGVAKVMLDTQYRMHRAVCKFSSNEFYQGRLKTGVADSARMMPCSKFPWPKEERLVFVDCRAPEDLGRRSKANKGQAEVCRAVCQLLRSREEGSKETDPDIAILTPYTRQRDLLKTMITGCSTSSIDGFQGREADIVIFVTVRSNASNAIGFLSDKRRLNVAATRARLGTVVIGDRLTLTGVSDEDGNGEGKIVWKELLSQCIEVDISENLS